MQEHQHHSKRAHHSQHLSSASSVAWHPLLLDYTCKREQSVKTLTESYSKSSPLPSICLGGNAISVAQDELSASGRGSIKEKSFHQRVALHLGELVFEIYSDCPLIGDI